MAHTTNQIHLEPNNASLVVRPDDEQTRYMWGSNDSFKIHEPLHAHSKPIGFQISKKKTSHRK